MLVPGNPIRSQDVEIFVVHGPQAKLKHLKKWSIS
jgi:hypothetical protein